jgi:hypothetical protein
MPSGIVVGMGNPIPAEHPWRVHVYGCEHGAGVLLDEWHVLTCAHVIGEEPGTAEIRSAVGADWTSTAEVVPDSWIKRSASTRLRDDVALLKLDRPAPSGTHTRLWRVPLSGGRVRVFGYPETATGGIPVDADLGGDGDHGELYMLNRTHAGGPWIKPGFSGAGVVVLDGEHAGRVIGIVVGQYRDGNDRGAWMMPTETIRSYLPATEPWVAGAPAARLGLSGSMPVLRHSDTLGIALTQELTRLLTDGWAGTVVISGGTDTGTSWLTRLVRTADPAARAGGSGFAREPAGTFLDIGAIDAAYDARDRSVREIADYLAERFGLSPGEPGLAARLLHRKPPVCLVIANIDQARSPRELLREMVRPLAAGARLRGARLILGFAGQPPSPQTLPYDVLLDPVPATGDPARTVTVDDTQAHLTELETAEAAAARLNAENERRFRDCPVAPPGRAPRLRVRFAVASASGITAEFAAIDGEIETTLGELESFTGRSARMNEHLEALRARLAVNRVRVERHVTAEDGRLGGLYVRARDALQEAPFDLAGARDLVDEYVAEADRRLDEEGRDDRENGGTGWEHHG